MTELTHSHSDPVGNKWIVEFNEFRIRDEHQRRVIASLDHRTLLDVLKIWLETVMPSAYISEQQGMAALTMNFATRAASRYFVTCFGGKSRPKSPS